MTWPTIFLREEITAGCAKRPYLTRWRLWTGPNGRAVYLHLFSCSDWARDLHDHRKIFGSIGLCGGYVEETVAPGEAEFASRLPRRRGLLRRAGRSNAPSTRRLRSRQRGRIHASRQKGGIEYYLAILGGTIMGSPAVSVAVRIEPEMRERMKRLAARRRRTQHGLMRDAIRQYIEREEARDEFLREALDAWQEYRETGLHASAGEVLAWLATWGAESETAAPACHE